MAATDAVAAVKRLDQLLSGGHGSAHLFLCRLIARGPGQSKDSLKWIPLFDRVGVVDPNDEICGSAINLMVPHAYKHARLSRLALANVARITAASGFIELAASVPEEVPFSTGEAATGDLPDPLPVAAAAAATAPVVSGAAAADTPATRTTTSTPAAPTTDGTPAKPTTADVSEAQGADVEGPNEIEMYSVGDARVPAQASASSVLIRTPGTPDLSAPAPRLPPTPPSSEASAQQP